jgi:hypothetical protein
MFGLGAGNGPAEMLLVGTNPPTARLNHSSPVETAQLILMVFRCDWKCGFPIVTASSINCPERPGACRG